MILWENVAYLADDERRKQAFHTLKQRVGTQPMHVLSASDDALLEVTRHGNLPEQFMAKLRTCAKIALLLRPGFGEEKKSYSTTYRSVQKAIEEGLDQDYSRLIEMHLLLRRHGQELCKRPRPECGQCPLSADCEFLKRGGK